MERTLSILTLSLWLVGCGQLDREGKITTSADGQSQMISVKEGNARIEAATRQARSEVSQFLQALQKPAASQSGFSVKIPVTDGRNTEFMWIGKVRYADGVFTGVFLDDAFNVEGNFKKGQPARCPAAEISDWLYQDGDRQVGGYTVKVLEELAAKHASGR